VACAVYSVQRSAAASFLDRHLETMKTVLLSQANVENVDQLKIDAKSLGALMGIHDSEDSHCGKLCEFYIQHKIIGDHSFMSWNRFADAITKIYGDQISDDPLQPQEVHLALTKSIDVMNVMWVTMDKVSEPFVQYMPAGESDWSNAAVATALTSTYTVPKKWWPIFDGTIYKADMSGLVAEEAMQYRVGGKGSDGSDHMSKIFTFKAAPISGGNADRRTVALTLADQGTFELLGFKVLETMNSDEMRQKLNYDMVHVSGDLSYAGLSSPVPALNISKEDEFEHVWDLLQIQNEPVAATVPWMVSNGNHERFYNWTAFTHRFEMPANEPSMPFGNGNFWYTYSYGNTRWISLSSEHDLSAGSPQLMFLTAALEAATSQRQSIPWIIVSIHKPLYCSAEGTPGGFAEALEPTFIEFDVDLVIVGHLHAYERVHPVQAGVVTVYPERNAAGEDVYYSQGHGPVQVVQGNAGGMQAEKWVQPQPAWSAVRMANGFIPKNQTSTTVEGEGDSIWDREKGKLHHLEEKYENTVIAHEVFDSDYDYVDTYGFGAATFVNSTHLFYQGIPVDGTVGFDSFWVVKRVSSSSAEASASCVSSGQECLICTSCPPCCSGSCSLNGLCL